MLDAQDRRDAPRRRFGDEAATYLGGTRLDAQPFDISIGGMFLQTPHFDDLSSGSIVGVALDGKSGFDPPLFLTGRVVRHQAGRRSGVGLHWVRAATTGNRDQLLQSLEILFDLPASKFDSGAEASTGRMKALYNFPEMEAETQPPPQRQVGPRAAEKKRPPTLPPRRDVPNETLRPAGLSNGEQPPEQVAVSHEDELGLSVSARDLGDVSVRVVHDEHGAHGRSFRRAFGSTAARGDDLYQALEKKLLESTEIRGSDMRKPPERTEKAARTVAPYSRPASEGRTAARAPNGAAFTAEPRAPVDLAGRMKVAGVSLPVKIKGMAATSLFLESPLAPVDPAVDILVAFEVRTGDGPKSIFATCTLTRIQVPEIGLDPGIIVRLVKTRVPEHQAMLGRMAEWIRKQG